MRHTAELEYYPPQTKLEEQVDAMICETATKLRDMAMAMLANMHENQLHLVPVVEHGGHDQARVEGEYPKIVKIRGLLVRPALFNRLGHIKKQPLILTKGGLMKSILTGLTIEGKWATYPGADLFEADLVDWVSYGYSITGRLDYLAKQYSADNPNPNVEKSWHRDGDQF